MAVNYLIQFGTGDPRNFTGLNATFLVFKDVGGNNVTAPGITEIPSGTGLYYFTWGTSHSIFFLADAATTSPGTAGRYVAGNLDPSDRISEYGNTLVAIGTSNIALGTTNVALGTTGVALGTTNVALGVTNVALGTTNVALGTSNIALGTTGIATTNAVGTTLVAQGATIVAIGNTLSALGATIGPIGISLLALIGTTASSFATPVDLFGYLKRLRELAEGNEEFVKGTGVLTMLDRTGGTTLAQKTISNNASLVTKT